MNPQQKKDLLLATAIILLCSVIFVGSIVSIYKDLHQ